MRGSDPLYYWDTCLFLAWIKDEERPTGEMDGVRRSCGAFQAKRMCNDDFSLDHDRSVAIEIARRHGHASGGLNEKNECKEH